MMYKIKKSNILLVAFLFCTAATQAAESSHSYLRLSVGSSTPNDLEYENDAWASASDGVLNVGLDNDIQSAVALGFRKNRTRFELEFAYREHDTDGADFSGLPVYNKGELGVTTLLTNVYFDLGCLCSIQPYIGAGLGAAYVEQNMTVATRSFLSLPIKDNDVVFAAQAIAGVGINITSKLTLQADVKYLATSDFESSSGISASNVKLDASYTEASANLGLRYAF